HSTVAGGYNTKAAAAAGIPPFKEEDLFKTGLQQTNSTVNPQLLLTLIRKGGETLDWIGDLGFEWEPYGPVGCVPKGVFGRTWLLMQKETTDFLTEVAGEKGVEFLFKSKAAALVRENGRIVGVQGESEGESLFVKARKAVILAAGGMSNNREMLKKYVPRAYYGCSSAYDMPCNTGEAIRMGTGAGADLAGIDSFSQFDAGTAYFDEGLGPWYRYLYTGDIQLARQPWLKVNKLCDRFMAEDCNPLYFGPTSVVEISQPGGRVYVIFDSNYERNILAFDSQFCEKPLTPDLPGMDKWDESICPKDWRVAVKEAIEKGAIKHADTIEGLASELGLDPVKFKKTVETYNGYCAEGKDPEFGMNPKYLIPVQDPPFYGVKVGPQLEVTYCGLRVNPQMQVLDKDCNIIPGLYAAFHTAGGAVGENVAVHSILFNCGLAYTSGYIAGDNAAAE
ncbi:MAG: FAD-binding protein, partial [Anaerolineae bacterium]|nr:FAD-binding protein [Anaerolineae bacterium]